jgi:photosystem II stability/assembly factor-like uncharacterized protein
MLLSRKRRHMHAAEFTVEKGRQADYVRRYAFPLRDSAPAELEAFWDNHYRYQRDPFLNWSQLGPANYAGRATCIAAAPGNPYILFAGSAGGGLWKSVDRARSWKSCWPNGLNQNIGAIAFDPHNPERLICATGEGNFSAAAYPGSGIYQTTDGGLTWSSFIVTPRLSRLPDSQRDNIPRRIASISFSATEAGGFGGRIAFGAVSNDPSLVGGLYLDTGPSGLSFVTAWGDRPYNCYCVAWHPTDPKILYATIEACGTLNGIWRSHDAGISWKHLNTGMPSGEMLGRISIAISPSDPKVLYALASSRHRRIIGVFVSTDGGDSWADTAGPVFKKEGQLAYNNTIAIHPRDPHIVICGAQNLFRTTDGGGAWTQISFGDPGDNANRLAPQYVHPDHHGLAMPGGDLLYSANDGGIAVSYDLGDTWRTSSRGMVTSMFYEGDVSAADPSVFGGGTQDGGTLIAGVNAGDGLRAPGKSRRDFVRVLAGDGGWIIFDPQQVERVYASSMGRDLKMHEPRRRWSRGLQLAPWLDLSPPISKDESGQRALTVLALEPSVGRNRGRLFLGTYRLWTLDTFLNVWRLASDFNFDGSSISAIEFSPAQQGLVYVGTSLGGIFRSRDGGRTWTADLAGSEIPQVVISDISAHPTEPDTVAVCTASTGLPMPVLRGHPRPFSHVFLSRNGGSTWTDIDRGALPNVVFNSLDYESRPPFRLFAGGDAGPWAFDELTGWTLLSGDFPNVVISDLTYDHSSRSLTVFTYGRGVWRLRVPRTLNPVPADPNFEALPLLPPTAGYTIAIWLQLPEVLSARPRQRAAGATFQFRPIDGAHAFVVEVVSASGLHFHAASPQPQVTVSVPDPGRARWRAWALFPNGRCSLPTQEFEVEITR